MNGFGPERPGRNSPSAGQHQKETEQVARLSQAERNRLVALIQEGKPLPLKYRSALFADDDAEYVEATKDYRLVYKGKISKEAVLRTTPAAPLQQIRSFNTDNPFDDDWRNMLIFGDNLLALKAIYDDQQGPDRYRTKNKIKLIYIDPPFATRQDFMKDREKAYRDKVIGAQFLEFLRRRVVLMREILAPDGVLFVHLDTKKSHYIKALLDEVFGETCFRNEIIWKRQSAHNDAGKCGAIHDTIFFYTKSDQWAWNDVRMAASDEYVEQFFDQLDPATGRRYARGDLTAAGVTKAGDSGKPWRGIDVTAKGRHWALPDDVLAQYGVPAQLSIQEKLDALDTAGVIHWPRKGVPRLKRFADEVRGVSLQDVWTDIRLIHNQSSERVGYPTQKPEALVARILEACTERGGIILDAFVGSGTTAAVAEKLGRRWICMDCGKLGIYTTQNRLLHLSSEVGGLKQLELREHDRVTDLAAHYKAPSRGLLMVYEKARCGDLNITDELLTDLGGFLEKHLSGSQQQEFSLMCPEEKFQVRELELSEDDLKAGEKAVNVGKVRFLISFIQPKEKPEKPKPLKAKEFGLYHAGIYDKDLILNLNWEQYRPFVLQLFGVREESHPIRGLTADGYVGLHSAYLWEYPKYPELVLDRGYIESLHEIMQGRGGDRFYVIAPGAVMAFMEDEIRIGKTTYVVLKVPLSVLMALIERGEAGSLKQPTNEESVNEVIDAVGYDFISQPLVDAAYTREKPSDEDLFNQKTRDFVVRLSDFRSNTLASDPEDFAPFETFSMVLVDTDYNGETFNLNRVFWADGILNEGRTEAVVRLTEDEVTGDSMMIIFMDKYGNELKVCKQPSDFKQTRQRRKASRTKAAPRASSTNTQGKNKK